MDRTVVIRLFTTFQSKQNRFFPGERRSLKEIKVSSYDGAKFSLSFRGTIRNRSSNKLYAVPMDRTVVNCLFTTFKSKQNRFIP